MIFRQVYDRNPLLLFVAAGCTVMALLFSVYGYERTWRLWNIPTMSPCFADARGLMAGAESRALGYDPLVNNPRDPWGRVVNYPRIWQLVSYLGVNQRDTIFVGISFAVLFFGGVFLFTSDLGPREALVMACCVFSSAVLFGIERGNSDLLVFFLLALSIRMVRKSSTAAAVLIGCAFLHKLYPIFAVSVFLREKKAAFQNLLLIFLFLGCAYTAVIGDELRMMKINSIQIMSPYNSFGIDVAWMQLQIGHHFSWAALPVRIASYAAVILIAAFSVLHAGRQQYSDDSANIRLDAFRVGASVYIGTYVIFGIDFDYKSIFLLFVVPQLLTWMQSPQPWIKRVATVTTTCVVTSLWSSFSEQLLSHLRFGGYVFTITDVSAKGMAFAGLLYLLIYSCPQWLKALCSPRALQVAEPLSVE